MAAPLNGQFQSSADSPLFLNAKEDIACPLLLHLTCNFLIAEKHFSVPSSLFKL